MVAIYVRDEALATREAGEVARYLERFGVWYRRFEGSDSLPEDAPAEAVLDAYREPIERLKHEGGYVTADVIDVRPDTPGLDAMLARFCKEHWHDEDEVRFIVAGRGIFHLHPPGHPVIRLEVEKGDMIRVPRGTEHWFDLCAERRIRAIRLFQDPKGWTPNYTGSGVDAGYEPLCFGPRDLPRGAAAR